MTAVKHFLLRFDRAKDELVECREFGTDAESALTAYSELEREHWDCPAMDIVLIGSDSLETVKVTHSTYFSGSAQRADSMRAQLGRSRITA